MRELLLGGDLSKMRDQVGQAYLGPDMGWYEYAGQAPSRLDLRSYEISTPFALSLSKGKRRRFILRQAQDERAQAVTCRSYFSSLNICASNR